MIDFVWRAARLIVDGFSTNQKRYIAFFRTIPMQHFKDTFVSREFRFSLGINQQTGGYYLSTPVSDFNRAVEWEAYFVINEEQYATFLANPVTTEAFTEQCRMGINNHLSIYPK